MHNFFPVVCNLSSVFTYRSPKEQVCWPHESTNSSAQVWPSLVTACSELHSVLKAPPLPQESWPHPVAHLWRMLRSPVSWANRGSRFGSLISAWGGFHSWEVSERRRAGESLSTGRLNKTILFNQQMKQSFLQLVNELAWKKKLLTFLRRHHCFPSEMTSEGRQQKFYTNDTSLPRSR